MSTKWFLITDGDWDAVKPLAAEDYGDAMEEALGDLGGQIVANEDLEERGLELES